MSQGAVELEGVGEAEKSAARGCSSRHVVGVALLAVLLVMASCAVCLVSHKTRAENTLEEEVIPCSQRINDQILTLGMKKLGDMYYYFSEIKHEWWKAERECKSRGLLLLTILSKEQNDVIKAYVRAMEANEEDPRLTSFWTAATSLAGGELLWFGPPETPLAFSDVLNEDEAVRRGRCVHVERTGPSVYWRVNECQERFRYVCQLQPHCLPD